MRSRLLAVKLVALVLGLLTLIAVRPALALDIELPGERQLQIHGFYETRLRFIGEDMPFGGEGVTFSQFRHVLDLETELEILPEGYGVFDTLFLFTRWVFSYECIYDGSCDLFNSADSFGEDHRNPLTASRNPSGLNRMPKNLKPARVPRIDAGGVFPLKFRPGSLRPIRDELNPGLRLRNCFNDPGVVSNPNGLLGALCNLDDRSFLDGPVDEFQEVDLRTQTRGGAFNPSLRLNLLKAARPVLQELAPRDNPAKANRFEELQDQLINAEFLSEGKLGVFRSLTASSLRAFKAGDTVRAEELALEAAKLIHTDPDSIAAGELPLFDDPETTKQLIETRPDKNVFTALAASQGRDAQTLLSSLWGASQLKDFILPYLATLDTEIEPFGYFTGPSSDTVDEFAVGLADKTEVPGSGFGDLEPGIIRLGAVPFLVGPDGRRNSHDDLPFFQTGMRQADANDPGGPDPIGEFEFKSKTFVTVKGTEVELFRSFKDEAVVQAGCIALGGVFASGACQVAGADVTSTARRRGCKVQTGEFQTGGINQDGSCVKLPVAQAGIPFATLEALANLDFRPERAVLEPTDLTDFKLTAKSDGKGIPARPGAPGGGLYFTTRGVQKLVASSSRLVSSLDLEFSEDRLRWGHGASEDENEFKEGYLEFEMFDGNFFARVGKLILVWGKTELFRNQDRNNPLDISNGVITRLEESRIGQWIVDMVYSPEAWMRVGPVEDLRLELAVIFDDFEPIDLGACGENTSLALVCLKSFGAMASGLAGLGLVGEVRPDQEYSGFKAFDYGIRLEGRWDRFTFAVTNFWGWDDVPYVDLVFQYGRQVDPNTGAPVNSTGPLTCGYRTNSAGVRVGPNGIPGDGDDDIPSSGNCLLWDNPGPDTAAGPAQQLLRASGDIALSHSANQTLFHTICTLTFDPDNGFCAVDQINDPGLFPAIANILGGGFFGSLVTDGVRYIRTAAAPAAGSLSSDDVKALMFKPVGSVTNISALKDAEKALLGCGPAFLSPCGDPDKIEFLDDPSIVALLEGRSANTISGGVDLMNADAGVITQENTLLKEAGTDALIGVRTPLNGDPRVLQYFEAGIQSDGMTPEDVIALGTAGRREFEANNNDPTMAPIKTDAWVEPLPWVADPNRLAEGILVYQVANQNELDPRCLDPTSTDPACFDSGVRRTRVFNDPTDPNNPLNVFRRDDSGRITGESCIRSFGDTGAARVRAFDAGCTNLELVSANFERLTIALEIAGADRIPDPPESLQELGNVLSDNFARMVPSADPTTGDPVSGPDGIFAATRFTGLGLAACEDGGCLKSFVAGEHDTHLVRNEGDKAELVGIGPIPLSDFSDGVYDLNDPESVLAAARNFMRDFDPEDCGGKYPTTVGRCHLFVGNSAVTQLESISDPDRPLLTVLPVALEFFDITPGKIPSQRKINFLKLYYEDPDAAMALLQQPGEDVNFLEVTIDGELVTLVPNARKVGNDLTFFGKESGNFCQDLDNNNVCDLDQDDDGVYDGADDYTPGPASDDNILCGSGLPGDVLQDALQVELYLPSERAALAASGGLPPRSPVFCRSLVGLLGATGQTLPVRRAGGDGTFGRRDFIWHAGRQISLNYQKRNVFGFALDFAEDVTKTSWGIEFTWTADKLFANLNSFSGLNQSDESILSISVDRPTFINYLNPNRSFFLNFQFFIRYLSDYEGGRDDKDGSFGVAEGPLDTRMVFTFFTGYFQDRLQPRVTMIYDPTTSNGGVLSQLQYRWTEAFSTTVGYNTFFGRPRQVQQAYFPVALRGTSDTTSEALTRTLAPVHNEDFGFITIRFSF